MRINRGFLGWGVFLVLVGAVPLAVRGGYLTEDQIPRIASLWPLILIGIGVGILLARTRFAFAGGMVIAATFGLVVGGWLAVSTDSAVRPAGPAVRPHRSRRGMDPSRRPPPRSISISTAGA
jgi:hypothetical protein